VLPATLPAPDPAQLDALCALLGGRRIAVLTGAGCSTESGIPDYRGPETRRRARNPMQAREFLASPEARARYWSRSALGWPRIASARPNQAHRALSRLEAAGALLGVITQNVDGLHQAAGSRQVVELHGALSRVRCLSCGRISNRQELQQRLQAENPGWCEPSQVDLAPDGDAEREQLGSFRVPACRSCHGVLKPDVVFFGEGVPRPVVDSAFDLLHRADALLVVGSSLVVFSGFRFVRRAKEQDKAVAIVNLGATRGDEYATLCVSSAAGSTLSELSRRLAPDAEPAPSDMVKDRVGA
jgi:NAD-dependent SIR2 family protein deacetylase